MSTKKSNFTNMIQNTGKKSNWNGNNRNDKKNSRNISREDNWRNRESRKPAQLHVSRKGLDSTFIGEPHEGLMYF
jgi:hypothetical protein